MTAARLKKISGCLGIKTSTLYQHLVELRKRTGCHSSMKMITSRLDMTCQQVAVMDMGLTPRETEVFLLILDGLTTSQIAHRLSISESGVKRHREKILLKSGRGSMLELAAMYTSELHRNDGERHETLFS